MPTNCIVRGCKNTQESAPNVTFHRFPHDKLMMAKWVEAIDASDTVKKLDVICSDHFAPDSFTNRFGRSCVKANTVPTRNLPKVDTTNDVLQEKETEEMVTRSRTAEKRKIVVGAKKVGRPRKAKQSKKSDEDDEDVADKTDEQVSTVANVAQQTGKNALKLRDRIVALESENQRLLSEFRREQTKNRQLEEKLSKLNAPLKVFPRLVITRIQF